MNKEILVSVVIPTYNSENFISDCLDATVNQTYENIEILIVDNGSTDSTRDVCAQYLIKDKRIKLYLTENNGVSMARNYGIERSNGEYIVFFDADDRPESNIIESYINATDEWSNRSFSLITCGMYFDNIFNKNVEDEIHILEKNHGFIEGENYLLKRNYASTLSWLKLFNFVTNKLYDNRKIKAYDIRFDKKINIGEDLKFNLDYLDKCNGYIGMINSPLYHYIKRSNSSLSITYHENDVEDTKDIYRRFVEWESNQVDVSEDNILVVKSIYIIDWISRLTTAFDTFKNTSEFNDVVKELNNEISSPEFQEILKDVHAAKKISLLKYLSLKSKNFKIFCFFRSIYQLSKG